MAKFYSIYRDNETVLSVNPDNISNLYSEFNIDSNWFIIKIRYYDKSYSSIDVVSRDKTRNLKPAIRFLIRLNQDGVLDDEGLHYHLKSMKEFLIQSADRKLDELEKIETKEEENFQELIGKDEEVKKEVNEIFSLVEI